MNTIKVDYKTVHPLKGLFDETKTTQLKVADALSKCMMRNSIYQKYQEDKDAGARPKPKQTASARSNSAHKVRQSSSVQKLGRQDL